MGGEISKILQKYYNEAQGGLVDKTPSTLNRGEATEIEYYIYKIDLVGSTLFVKNRTRQTYLKLAHTFLSAVDEITRIFGAEGEQAEYAGDSVIAYFRASKVAPIKVLAAAYYCRLAAREMKNLDATFRLFPFRTTAVLHYGKLIMAKIGPRGDSRASAIGPELHKACKMEANVGPGGGKASREFFGQLQGIEKLCLKGNYTEKNVLKLPDITPKSRAGLLAEALTTRNRMDGLLSYPQAISSRNSLLGDFAAQPAITAPQYETKRELVDYSIQWDFLERHLDRLP